MTYTRMVKLSGCKDGEFTCDDGQCVRMDKRCNQLPNCRDGSDERMCKIMHLKEGYNKRVPPITSNNKTLVPVPVKISIALLKVVQMEEEDLSIELQFEITLIWKENRATFYNLKTLTALNSLSDADIGKLWLPLVTYDNTDQKETTRLGNSWEWRTFVTVLRQGGFSRNWLEELDETEIFKGDENSLRMQQTYTHNFQCVYDLQEYPFDTQV